MVIEALAKCRFVILSEAKDLGSTGFLACAGFCTAWKGRATNKKRFFSRLAPSE
jgi:hypothetical protein